MVVAVDLTASVSSVDVDDNGLSTLDPVGPEPGVHSTSCVTDGDDKVVAPWQAPPPLPFILPPHLTLIMAKVLLAGLMDLQHQQATAWLTQGPVLAARGQEDPVFVPPEASSPRSQ